ncbi:YopX family protein [Bacillus sp. TH25]|uniref:YopX family protein n=1 Tax=Bacillus sp. TH25 TaxID=2796391 RepID=UPI00191367F5|nr:YopX family protein [Bacillus sp. TH25]MBK5433379.1 hypothetical protein [Bacillus sp. TH25]
MKKNKFRAWHKEKKCWISFHNNGYAFNPSNGQIYYEGLNITSRIDLVQCIALIDKNGKEIYEGDILKGPALYETPENTATTYSHWKVTYNNCSFYLRDSPIEEDIDWISEECEVVGNVYENPELLEN